MANLPIIKFNSGEHTGQIDARTDVAKYSAGCRHLENFIPRIYGGAERRPGTYYIASAYGTSQIVCKIPFIYSSTVAYTLEFGNKYIRIFYNGSVIETITSPYSWIDLLQIQHRQVGDVMWLVHPSYAQRKLTRTTATTFALTAINYYKGPFLLRNDLIDPDETDTATMACTVTTVGAVGTLTCTGRIFDADHVGAIFKLIHPRDAGVVSLSGAGTSSALDVKGNFTFNTHGRWTGTVVLQRRENSASSNDWENYRTYKSDNDRNVQFSGTEEADNVEYRIYSADASSEFSGEITSSASTQTGIVRIDSVTDALNATVTVLTGLDSTNATKRWAEGAWSDYRGYPNSITFKNDRCIYGGQSDIPTQILEVKDYYLSGEDGQTAFGGATWQAQTFTPSASYNCTGVSVKLWRTAGTTPGTITVGLRRTSASKPTTNNLTNGTTDGNTLPTSAATAVWRKITFPSPVYLIAATMYGLVVRATGAAAVTDVKWRADTSSPSYTGGSRNFSTNSGSSYTTDTTIDFMFITYGSALPTQYDAFATTADTAFYYASKTVWSAQTFTPSSSYSINSVRVKMFRITSKPLPGTVTVSIRATSASKPTGADLASGTFDGDGLGTGTDTNASEWREVVLSSPLSLTAGTQYAIVVRATAADDTDEVGWASVTGGGYTGGAGNISSTSGVDWSTQTYDFLFETYIA